MHGVSPASCCCVLLVSLMPVAFECSAVFLLQDPDEAAIYTSGELYTNPNDFLLSKVNFQLRKTWECHIYFPQCDDRGLNKKKLHHQTRHDNNYHASSNWQLMNAFFLICKAWLSSQKFYPVSACDTNSACSYFIT